MTAERVLICGDRGWKDLQIIATIVNALPPDTVVIHGACAGADQMASLLASGYGLSTWAFPAQWARFGKRAGPVRNQRMLDEGRPTLVVAFHNYLPGSKGTKDMVLKARLAGIPVQLFNAQGEQVEITDEMFAPQQVASQNAN